MCDPMTMLVAASTTMQVAGSINQGKAVQRSANEQAAQLEYQAAVDQDNAMAEAGLIRRAGRADRGRTLTALAASGVEIGEGSALDAERQVMEDSETDAAIAILNGQRAARGAQSQAESSRRAGRDARRAGNINAFGSLLSAGANGLKASGWRSAGPGFSGTQAPAPVEIRNL